MSVVYCEECDNNIDTDFYELECTEYGHELL